MKAIKIKYIAQTNTKPSRYKATTDHQSLMLSSAELWDIRLKENLSHLNYPHIIAMELCKRQDWSTRLHTGQFGPCEWFACFHQEELIMP